MGRSIDSVTAGLPKARRERIETKAVRLAREMIDHAELSLVIRTKQGAEIVLQSLGDLGSKENGATKLRRVTPARMTKRRAMFEGVK